MRVLVVDDEPLVRVGISSVLRVAGSGFEVVGEAADGAQALELARGLRPDIALVDIRMPVMDGLAFIEAARRELPRCRFVILSNADEFPYAQAALKLGATDYILKSSIDAEDLLQVLARVRGGILAERSARGAEEADRSDGGRRGDAIARRLNLLIDGVGDPADLAVLLAAEGTDAGDERCVLAVFEFDPGQTSLAARTDPELRLAYHAAVGIAEETLSRWCRGHAVGRADSQVIAWMYPRQARRENPPGGLAREACGAIAHSIGEYLGLTVSAGFAPAGGIAGARDGYRRARVALAMRFYRGPGRISAAEEAGEVDLLAAPELARARDEAGRCVLSGDLKAIPAAVARLEAWFRERAPRDVEAVQGYLYAVGQDTLEGVSDAHPDLRRMHDRGHLRVGRYLGSTALRDLCGMLEDDLLAIARLYRESESNCANSIVSRLAAFVRENLAGDASLAAAAARLKMNASYLGRVYRTRTGESFSDHVTRQRIALAKELLLQGEKLSHIAERTGYSDMTALSRAFKKATGIRPVQFRRRSSGG